MSVTMRASVLAVGLGLFAFAPARADEMACKPGVGETTFEQATYLMPEKNIHQLRGEMEVWVSEQELSSGGTGFYDPKTGEHNWTIIMQPKEEGVALTVQFSTKSDKVEVAVENICWEDQQDWRPSWKFLNSKLIEWGYRPVAKP